MKRTVEEVLMDYKKCTEGIIELLKREDFDFLQDEMIRRQCILNELIYDSDKKDKAREVYKKLNIGKIESEAGNLLKEKALLIKGKLKNISMNKIASSAYGNLGNSAKIFSKKI